MARRRANMSERAEGTTGATVTAIARTKPLSAAPPAAAGQAGVALEVAVGLIDPSPANPRSAVRDVSELAKSMRSVGVVQELKVRRQGERYELIHGHRRLAAAKLAGLATVPVVLDESDPDPLRDLMVRLVENMQREDLTPLEEARAFQEALEQGIKGGQRTLAAKVGKSQAHISKRLSLLKLPDKLQGEVDSGGISVSDATELAQLADDPARLKKAVKAGAEWGGISRAVASQLRDRDNAKTRETAAAELRAAGVTVLEHRHFNAEDGPYPLVNLGLDPAEHAKLPCHAAVVESYGSGVTLVCVDPHTHRAHGSKEAAMAAREREAAERAAYVEARRTEGQARREFAAELVRKGSPEAGAAVLVEQLVSVSRDYYMRLDEELVGELLGVKPDTNNGGGPGQAITAFVGKGTRNAQRGVYAAGLAFGETAVGSCDDRSLRYLEHLAANGYVLSDVEQNEIFEARVELGLDDAGNDEQTTGPEGGVG